MAVSTLRDNVGRVLFTQLNPRLRYRCLVVQSPDLQLIKEVQLYLEEIIREKNGKFTIIDGNKQFDAVGAVACQDLLATITSASKGEFVIIAGPLHFLDYWSRQIRSAFWSSLATVTSGAGIIVLDVPREAESDEVFRVVGQISGTDARYLKSRLAITQDGLV